MRKAISLFLIVLLSVSVVFAQGGAEKQEAKDAPKTEGVVNVYSIMPEAYASIIFDEFTKDTGIKVNFTRMSAGDALARLTAEKDNPQVDALWGGPSDTYDAGVAKGLFQVYVPKEADKIPANYRSPEGYWTGVGLIPLCFVTNTNFLKEHNLPVPTSWYDLLDPAYEGQLQMADARTSGTATERIYALCYALGSEDAAYDYQKKLNKNVQLYTKSGGGGLMPIGTGQSAGGIFYLVDALKTQQEGYPIEISYPKEGVTYSPEGSGIVAGAKNINAAKALMDWASTKRLGDIMMANKINYVPVRADVEVSNPALNLSTMPLIESDSAWKGANRERLVQRWIDEVITAK